eukprot:3066121-Amphidinium_carterae.2
MSQSWLQWAAAAEHWLCQAHAIEPTAAYLGRGQGVTFRRTSVQQLARVRRPPRTTPQARAWKRLHHIVDVLGVARCSYHTNWRAKFQWATRAIDSLLPALQPLVLLNQWWTTWSLVHATVAMPCESFFILQQAIADRARVEWEASAREGTCAWHAWAKQPVAGGARPAHHWLRREVAHEQDPDLDGEPLADAEGARATFTYWRDLWSKHTQPLQVPADMPLLPPITPQELQLHASQYPLHKACGGDAWTPRHWAMLPHQYFVQLAVILNRFERDLCYPKEWCSLIVLKTKPSGGCRPLSLMAAAVRVYGRVRKHIAQRWEQRTEHPFHYGIGHKDCEFAGWQLALLHGSARAHGCHAASIYLDIQKAFEHVTHRLLQCSAIRHGLPLRLLHASLVIYGSQRCITWRSICSTVFQAPGTIVAGDALATSYMRLALHTVLCEVSNLPSPLPLRIQNVVDDISIHAQGSAEQVIATVAPAGECLMDQLCLSELPHNVGKTVVLATTHSLANDICAALHLQSAPSTTHWGTRWL